VRRALKRAGVLPPRVPRDPEATRPVPPPRIFLPGEAEDAGPVDLRALFGRSAPVELEIGTGKGRFRMEAAPPGLTATLGIEIEREYAFS
jgi:tRNA G46 methylase TrmB